MVLGDLIAVQQWLQRSLAEAQERLPVLLDLPAGELRKEFERSPELRTAGMMQHLITVAGEALPTHPQRAYELTCIVVETVLDHDRPPGAETLTNLLEALGWIAHANALYALDRLHEAHRAVYAAREVLAATSPSHWHAALADLAESKIAHAMGQRDRALELVRRAAAAFGLFGDQERLVETRMTEAWMLWTCGDGAAAADVWRESVQDARVQGNDVLLARFQSQIGYFELQRTPDEAWRLLSNAVAVFEAHEMKADAARTRCNMAQAALRRGRVNEAISEEFKAFAQFLSFGAVIDAAMAATEILELLPMANRDEELSPLAETLVGTFARAAVPRHAVEAFTWVQQRVEEGALTADDVAAVRDYLAVVVHQPNAPFRPPD